MDETVARGMLKLNEYGQSIQHDLQPDDPRLNGVMHLVHEDGTVMFLSRAFTQTVGDWVYFFTAHHGFLIYHKDRLRECKRYEALPEALAPTAPPLATTIPPAELGNIGFGDMPMASGDLLGAEHAAPW